MCSISVYNHDTLDSILVHTPKINGKIQRIRTQCECVCVCVRVCVSEWERVMYWIGSKHDEKRNVYLEQMLKLRRVSECEPFTWPILMVCTQCALSLSFCALCVLSGTLRDCLYRTRIHTLCVCCMESSAR